MELYNEDYKVKNKKSKLPTIITIIIILLILLTVGIVYLIFYINSTVTRINLDGVSTSSLEKILYINEKDGNLYIPIRKIASYFKYKDYSGDYKYKSEDSTKCHVENENETAMFTLDSSILVKTRGNSDYEYIDLDQKVFQKDGELYTTIDGIEKAYNVSFTYDKEKKRIDIYTMNYLLDYYTKYLKIEDYSTAFNDKKAILEGMIVKIQNGKYGVVKAQNGEAILETKYDKIEYLQNTSDFMVKSNGKCGILSQKGEAKIKIAYDDIDVMDNENGLYLIKENGYYGILDSKGNVILEPNYQQIGTDINQYAQNGVENKYVLLNKLIPVKQNNLWGFFDLKGKQIADFKYTGLGCTTSKVSNTYPTLIIPSYDIVIVKKDNFYNLMMLDGKELINGYVVDSVYMTVNVVTSENKYYMTYNGNTQDIEQLLLKQGY